jgi:hypothetical protein
LQETDDRAINLDPSQPSVSLIAHAAQSSLSNHPASDVYLDSGATQHMFHQRSRFSNFKPIPSGGKSIEGIGNSRVEIRGIGDVTFNASVNGATQPITFYNSLFAPELGINLISVGAITASASLSPRLCTTTFSRCHRRFDVLLTRALCMCLLSLLLSYSECNLFFSHPT